MTLPSLDLFRGMVFKWWARALSVGHNGVGLASVTS
jgi:hypothetical protein